ncbi:MAG: hypothetical protein Q7S04_03430 [Candidatus Moranbacteria bacterium]|nr:hypothetical protein [Candidatus Moranbacteria bacterium]
MEFFQKIQKTETLLILFGLSFVVFGWFVFLLALFGLFLSPLVVIGTGLIGVIILFLGGKLLLQAPLDCKVALLVVVFFAAFIGYFSEPTLFTGRDQGSITEAAFHLVQNGQLAFSTKVSQSFFQIYGVGTALNFPGFAYTKAGDLITQFPLGYTAWLAGFISLFGLLGLTIGNVILLFLFLFTLYNLLRLFVHPYYAFAGLGLALFSFLPTWFAKITLSENLAVFLFTFLIFSLILFLREGGFISYVSVLLSASLLAFTRIEGFAFLLLTLVIISFSQYGRNIWKTSPWKSLVLPCFFFIFIFLRDFFINLPYYKMMGKALLKFSHQLGGGDIASDLANSGSSFPLGSVFFLYGLLVLFMAGFFGILLFIKEKRPLLLLPAAIALPTFLYLFDPNISLDHPWMLRRFLFSLFPTLLFSATVGLALLFDQEKILPIGRPQGKRLFFVSFLFLGLIAFQLPAWSYGIPFAENRTLYEQTAAFSEEFSDTDLVLVDRNATGDGFSMLSGPAQFLFGKNMAYFFNPSDLEKLDTTPFRHTYLLVPEGDQGRYASVFGNRLVLKKMITFSGERFENVSLENGSPLHLPKKIPTATRNLLFEIY